MTMSFATAQRRAPRTGHLVAVVAVLTSVLATVAPPAAGADETPRTFGSTPADDVIAAATAAVDCDLSRDELVAIVLAPTFPETGAPTTQAPSPMTLSRWDNKPAIENNVETWRLFAFADKGTPYRRAFWNPGVGPWQFDSAGLRPYSAESYISTGVAAGLATNIMAARWCTAKQDKAKYPDNRARRAYAWGPWHACKSGICETIFQDLYDAPAKKLRNLVRDPSVGRWGGMEARSCKLPTVASEFLCFYVDPARAQGYTGGWTSSPDGIFDGDGRPVKTPLSHPFYVYNRGGKEYRHWLRIDTGYNKEISASRPIAANARTSLEWSDVDQLCDRSTFRGTCDIAPAPKSTRATHVSGSFTPVVGDFRKVGRDDIVWYAPSGGDVIWQSTGSGTFSSAPINVAGSFTPVVGDFNGGGYDDIYWFSPTGGDALYRGGPSGFTATYPNANGSFTPLAGDFNRDGRDDIYWFSPYGGDAIYWGSPSGFTATYPNANGSFTPLVGDFNGDDADDIYWFSPTGGDAIYWGSPSGFTATYPNANGSFRPMVGDFDGDTIDDIFWWNPLGGDAIYFGNAGGFSAHYLNADGPFEPVIINLDSTPGDDIIWYAPGASVDHYWKSTGTRSKPFNGATTVILGHYQPVPGSFDTTPGRDVLWYDPSGNPDPLWYG